MLWFAFVATVMMATVLPKTAVSILCGVLYPLPVACGLIVGIATAAALLDYAAGRCLHRWVHRRFNPATTLGAVATTIGGATVGLHLCIRLSPVPSMLVSLVCGSLGCRLLPFSTAAALAAVTQWVWVYAASATADATIRTATVTATNPGGGLRWGAALLAIGSAVVVTWILSRSVASKLATQPAV